MATTPQPLTPGLTPAQLNYADTAQWKQALEQVVTDLRCATAAFLVDDMDPVTQTVTVQVAIQERVSSPTGQQWWDVPPIVHVPILIPRGGGFSSTYPLKKGDQGMLIFCDTCFDNWWVNGQEGSPPAYYDIGKQAVSGSQTQLEVRRHYVHDCGFLPGMYSQNRVLENYSTTSMQHRSDDGDSVVDIASNGIKLTSDSVDLTANSIVAGSQGGATQPLMLEAFYTWFTTVFLPTQKTPTYTPYAGPDPPTNSVTTVLKGE